MTQTDVSGRIGWDDFLSSFRFKQGEHVTILGPTGEGKSTLALELLPRRQYVVVFGTKPKDTTLDRLKRSGYTVERNWPPEKRSNRVLLWPRLNDDRDIPKQHDVFARAMRAIYREGGWTEYIDEIEYITSDLKLDKIARLHWRQGRSNNLTVIAGNQRPAWVPLAAYSEATHLFLFRNPDEQNMKRISELGSFDKQRVYAEVASLNKHEVLYVNTRSRDIVKTKVERSDDARSR